MVIQTCPSNLPVDMNESEDCQELAGPPSNMDRESDEDTRGQIYDDEDYKDEDAFMKWVEETIASAKEIHEKVSKHQTGFDARFGHLLDNPPKKSSVWKGSKKKEKKEKKELEMTPRFQYR